MDDQDHRVIDLGGTSESIEVRGLGACTVRCASMALELELAREYTRPLHTDYRAFSCRLLAGRLVEPQMSPSDIDGLPEHTRARLRTVVAEQCEAITDLRRLRGSHLGPDERLFAAMLWRYERWSARMAEAVIGIGTALRNDLAKAIVPIAKIWRERADELLAPIRNITRSILSQPPAGDQLSDPRTAIQLPRSGLLGGFDVSSLNVDSRHFSLPSSPVDVPVGNLRDLLGASDLAPSQKALSVIAERSGSLLRPDDRHFQSAGLARAMEGLRPFLRHVWDEHEQRRQTRAFISKWERSSYWFLLSLVTRQSTKPLHAMSKAELEGVVLDALETAVRDPAFTLEVRRSVAERAPLLTSASRRHLTHGLEHASVGEWVDALPPLLNGLEGAFWQAARALNVINADRFLHDRPTKLIRSVDALFKHLPATPSYRTFLKHRVFGTTGNAYRHGDQEGGEREQVLFAVAALVGWLEEFADTPATYELGTRLEGHLLSLAA